VSGYLRGPRFTPTVCERHGGGDGRCGYRHGGPFLVFKPRWRYTQLPKKTKFSFHTIIQISCFSYWVSKYRGRRTQGYFKGDSTISKGRSIIIFFKGARGSTLKMRYFFLPCFGNFSVERGRRGRGSVNENSREYFHATYKIDILLQSVTWSDP
jgi:hypothetical protein